MMTFSQLHTFSKRAYPGVIASVVVVVALAFGYATHASMQALTTPAAAARLVMDANADGQVSISEYTTFWSGFKQANGTVNATYDFNQDGSVSLYDFPAVRAALDADNTLSGQTLRAFIAMDANQDGKIDISEYVKFSLTFKKNNGSKNKVYDFNQDGGVSLYDFPAVRAALAADNSLSGQALRAFITIDASVDGKITPAEYTAFWANFQKANGTVNATYDFNQDGSVSLYDFPAVRAALDADNTLSGQTLRAFIAMDANQNGKVSTQEYKAFFQEFQSANGTANPKFDFNRDGGVSLYDYPAVKAALAVR